MSELTEDRLTIIAYCLFREMLKHRWFIESLADYDLSDDELSQIEWAEGNFAKVIRDARKFLKENPIDV